MKYLLLNAILFFSIVGCKKSTNTPTTTNPNAITGSWSLTFDSALKPIKGSTNTCMMDNLSTTGSTYYDYLLMSGYSSDGVYKIIIWVKMPSTLPVVGHYSLTDSGNRITLEEKYSDNPTSYHFYDASLYRPTSIMSFDVISYNPSTKAVSATFSGMLESFGKLYTLTDGTINGVLWIR